MTVCLDVLVFGCLVYSPDTLIPIYTSFRLFQSGFTVHPETPAFRVVQTCKRNTWTDDFKLDIKSDRN